MKAQQRKFTKLFESEKYGQILIIQDQSDPKLSIMVYPEGFGIITLSNEYESFEDCDDVFDSIDTDTANKIADGIFSSLE